MWVVGAITATRATRPSDSIRCATCRPNVVLPAAGVADARKASPPWPNTASAASCCQARRARVAGQGGRTRERAWRARAVIGRRRLGTAPDGTTRGRAPWGGPRGRAARHWAAREGGALTFGE